MSLQRLQFNDVFGFERWLSAAAYTKDANFIVDNRKNAPIRIAVASLEYCLTKFKCEFRTFWCESTRNRLIHDSVQAVAVLGRAGVEVVLASVRTTAKR